LNEHYAKTLEQDEADRGKKQKVFVEVAPKGSDREIAEDDSAALKRRKTTKPEDIEGNSSSSAGGRPRARIDDQETENRKKKRVEADAGEEDKFDDEGDCILLAETMNETIQVKKVRTSLLDLTKGEEKKKIEALGNVAWTKRIVKAIKKLKPDIIIGGEMGVHSDDWRKIYAEQVKQKGYYVHNTEQRGGHSLREEGKTSSSSSPIIATLDAERNSYYDVKAKKKMIIESNSEKVNVAFAGKKIHDPCSKVRQKMIQQHKYDIDSGKNIIMSMNVEGKIWDDAKGGWLIEEKVKRAREERW